METSVLYWNFSWEELLTCNFRVELLQGRMGKRCCRLDLFLVEGATLDGALSGKGEKTLL